MESAKNAMLKEKDRIQQQMERLKSFKQGTAEYNKLEEDVTHMQADYNAQTALKQKEFMEKESRIMMGVYREVADAVAVIAQQRGMSLVLKFNGDPVDPANRESVMREISKPFAYYSREADITPDVLAEVSGPARGGAANPNLRGAVRPGVPGRN
jgi:Skp family chaperone for outer membrane proteins